MTNQTLSYEVCSNHQGQRLDAFLAEISDLSRAQVQKLIKSQHIKVNKKVINKVSYKVKEGDKITVLIPPPQPLDVQAEPIALDIVYEDQDLVVVNKPQGMVVHPSPGHQSGTLVNALMAHCHDLSGINGVVRPGIVHRIDKDTSGLLVVAKNDYAHVSLSAQIKHHTVLRKYLAIVYGQLKPEQGTIKTMIGRHPHERKQMAVITRNGRLAVTNYRCLQQYKRFSLVELRLETGRTHQIRVHMAYMHRPVLGDPLYGPKKQPFQLPGQMLHAAELGFIHPRTQIQQRFSVAPPPVMQAMMACLEQE